MEENNVSFPGYGKIPGMHGFACIVFRRLSGEIILRALIGFGGTLCVVYIVIPKNTGHDATTTEAGGFLGTRLGWYWISLAEP